MVAAAGDIVTAAQVGGDYEAFTAYTPAWTSSGAAPTNGAGGVLAGDHCKVSRKVDWKVRFVVGGAGLVVGTGNYFFSLPFAARALVAPTDWYAGCGVLVDVSTAIRYVVVATLVTANTFWLNVGNANPGVMTAALPFVPAVGDWFSVGGTYESAA